MKAYSDDQDFRDAFLAEFRSLNARIAVTIGPVLIWLVALALVPLVFLVVVSFTATGETFQIIWTPTIENYETLLLSEGPLLSNVFVRALLISFAVATVTTFATMALAFPVAYLLARRSGRFLRIMFYLVLLPFFTIFLVRAYSWYLMFGNGGLVNHTLISLGIVDSPLSVFNYGFLATIVGLTHAFFPYMLFTLYASFDGLDFSLIESARDLGASRIATFKDIVLPLIMPGVISGCVFVFVPALGAFLAPEILGQGKIQMVGQLIETRVNSLYAIGYASAAAMFIIVPIVLVFVTAFKRASFKDLQL